MWLVDRIVRTLDEQMICSAVTHERNDKRPCNDQFNNEIIKY
jgi:hypothetical protein